MGRGAFLCASLCLIGVGNASAQEAASQDVDAQITAVREMVLYARYADAERAIDPLLARTDLTPAQRNEGLEIRAIILLARRQTPRAEAVLRELYGRDPEHRLVARDVGPNVVAAFERMRDSHPPPAAVTLDNSTRPRMATHQSPDVAVRISAGADVVHEMRVSYRNGTSGPFERVIMRFDEERTLARTRLPPLEGTEGYTVQYFVEALAPSQAVIATLGSESAPLSLEVPEDTGVRIAADGTTVAAAGGDDFTWVWVVLGVLVAGGAAATLGIVFGTDLVLLPETSLGTGRLAR